MQEKKGPNGFLLGLILGGAVGALVSTKRGRQILKDIAEYGLDYVGKSMDMDDIVSILDEEDDTRGSETVIRPEKERDEADIPKINMERKEEPPRKRLFRGIRRK